MTEGTPIEHTISLAALDAIIEARSAVQSANSMIDKQREYINNLEELLCIAQNSIQEALDIILSGDKNPKNRGVVDSGSNTIDAIKRTLGEK